MILYHTFVGSILLVLFSRSCITAKYLEDGDTEYNYMILDPETPYGTPYGGFSRATNSRLSALPLVLPHAAPEEVDDFDPFFTNIKDVFGRPYSCRSYHEDELDPRTLDDGMFVAPVFISQTEKDSFHDTDMVDNDWDDSLQGESEEILPMDDNTLQKVALETLQRELRGVCTQLHRDWWSYQWCFEGEVTQFHIHVEKNAQQEYVVQDKTSLGKFEANLSANVITKQIKTGNSVDVKRSVEIGEHFVDGDICPDTGEPRTTHAFIQCCHQTSKKKKNMIFHHGEPRESEIAYLKSVIEPKPCSYRVTICTPLMCDDSLSPTTIDPKVRHEKSDKAQLSNSEGYLNSQKIEEMSVSQIVSSVFDLENEGMCIQFGDGGWWVYEVCPGEYVRQFHEVDLLDRITGTVSRSVDTEYILGRYDASSERSKEREWELVVNSTSLLGVNSGQSGSPAGKPGVHSGNSAFLAQEYTGGDICDHTDVTDSAIKAGEVGEGLVERATTVRYGCGSRRELIVKEDSTCHYLADVTLPELCYHPFFRAPVAKKQVMKCLPNAPEDHFGS